MGSFTVWVEVFPYTQKESLSKRASQVVKSLLKEIIPRFSAFDEHGPQKQSPVEPQCNVTWEYLSMYWSWFRRPKENWNLKEPDSVRYVPSLGATVTALHNFASNRLMFPTAAPLSHFCPGDWVLPKSWKNEHPRKSGLYLLGQNLRPYKKLILLWVKPWIHHTQVGFTRTLSDILYLQKRPREQDPCCNRTSWPSSSQPWLDPPLVNPSQVSSYYSENSLLKQWVTPLFDYMIFFTTCMFDYMLS